MLLDKKTNMKEEQRREDFIKELPNIARMLVLYWPPTPISPSNYHWSIIEDLYCMMDSKPMPLKYPQVKRAV
jgi:hypothetical protein